MDYTTLGEALPGEIKRVKELIDLYESVPGGAMGARILRLQVLRAERVIMENDLVGMIEAYAELKSAE